MTTNPSAGERARTFFDGLWEHGDPWEFESSEFERLKFDHLLDLLRDRRYDRVLEIGCGSGAFTRQLSTLATSIVALDVSPRAIDAAKARTVGAGTISFGVANIMDYDPMAEGPWDLVVMSDTIYYIGWLYSFFDVAWLAHQLHAASRAGSRLLLANTCGSMDYLLLPWIIRTYRDLFANVGYRIEREDAFQGRKHDTNLEMLTTVFLKPGAGG